MSKSQFIHVLTRFIGIVFVFIAVWLFVGFVTNMMLLSNFTPTPPSPALAVVVDSAIRITLSFAAGIYLLADGKFVMKLLDYEGNE